MSDLETEGTVDFGNIVKFPTINAKLAEQPIITR